MGLELRAATADDTRAVGVALASVLEPGDAIVLTGELGAGKTTLVQGIAGGLEANEHVGSPTFTLVREYVSGRLPIAHVDVYRLQRVQDVVDLALDEIAGDGVLLVEWGDAVEEVLPGDLARVVLSTIDPTGVDETRRITVDTAGQGWARRLERLAAALSPWRVRP